MSEAERRRRTGLRIEKRRADWTRGRHAAKCAAAEALRERFGVAPPLSELEVDAEPSGAPLVRLAPGGSGFLGHSGGQCLPLSLSISHSASAVFCLATPEPLALGVDLERVERRSPAFAADFLAPEELSVLHGAPALRNLLLTAVWSAKEAVLKALHLGLTVDTRSVVCIPGFGRGRPPDLHPRAGGWRPFRVLRAPGGVERAFRGWWRPGAGFVWTIAVGPSLQPPRGIA